MRVVATDGARQATETRNASRGQRQLARVPAGTPVGGFRCELWWKLDFTSEPTVASHAEAEFGLGLVGFLVKKRQEC